MNNVAFIGVPVGVLDSGTADILARAYGKMEKSFTMVTKEFKRLSITMSGLNTNFSRGVITIERISTYETPVVDSRIYDRHSSYYRPPYFAIFGSNRPMISERIILPKCKIKKNARPKATHTNRKIYR